MRTLSYAITSLLYFTLVLGLYFIFERSFQALRGWFLLKKRLSPSIKDDGLKIVDKLDDLVFLATGKEEKGRSFLGLTLGLFFFLFTFGSFSFNFLLALLLAFLSALIPTLSLVSKFQKNRNKSSKEGLSFVSEILRQYRIEGGNILSCLEKTASTPAEYPYCGKQCYLLLLKLRSAGSRAQVKAACNHFADSIGSVWAKNVSQLIEYAIEGTDISEALTGIISELMDAKERFEEGKRLNAEAWRMSTFLVPFLYVSSVLLSIRFLGLSLGEFMKNQFFNNVGFLLFLLCVLLFCLNNIIISFISNRNVDI